MKFSSMMWFGPVLSLMLAARAFAADAAPIKFSFVNGELTQMIETYAKASGKKIVVDPGVRGKATIYAPDAVALDEAFNLLADALEANGFSYSERGDVIFICSARNIQRDLLPIYHEAPPLRPARMATLIMNLKHASAEEINKRLRILPSKDGEMTPYEPSNQIIINDYTPNLARIYQTIQELDKPETKEFTAKKAAWEKKKLSEKADNKVCGLTHYRADQ